MLVVARPVQLCVLVEHFKESEYGQLFAILDISNKHAVTGGAFAVCHFSTGKKHGVRPCALSGVALA